MARKKASALHIISVVIPCLNEKKTITKAISQAQLALKQNNLKGEIIVADNGSTDGTLTTLKKQKKARVIHVPVRGYGAALHWGIMSAKTKYVFFADADLSYDFTELKKFLPHIKKNYDIILGSRFKGVIKPRSMPFLNRYLGTPILTFLIRLLYHLPVTDSNSGMRVVKTKFYKQLHMRNAGMEWASELLIKTAYYNGTYTEVPITLYPDKRYRPPHLIPWSDGWRHLKAIILLRPNILFVPVLVLLAVTVALFPFHKVGSYISLFLASGLGMSVLAAKMLHFAIDQITSQTVALMLKLPLVPAAILASMVTIFITVFSYPVAGIELLVLWSELIMFLIWIFFIETIKTHAINKLPDTT